MNQIHEKYLESNNLYREYRKQRHGEEEEYWPAVYDLACEMQSIEAYIQHMDNNIRIIRILENKPTAFFEDGMDYSFVEQMKRHEVLISYLVPCNI